MQSPFANCILACVKADGGGTFNKFEQRVQAAAEAALKSGSVGPLDLLMHMGFIQPVHFEGWQRGIEHYRNLEEWIQVGPEKFGRTFAIFKEWVKARGLVPMEAPYTRQTPKGVERLLVTSDGAPLAEKFYCTRYVPAGLSEKKTSSLAQKVTCAADLVVFEKVGQEGACSECGATLDKGSFVFRENNQPLCLTCADMDHLVFLPAGDTALTRRARKHSPLSAVVVRFNRSRKRYERRGLLVTEAAIIQAEDQCAADAPERAAARARAAVARHEEDREYVEELTQFIAQRYPQCPVEEARQIAQHTALRGSGRVGRSAAAHELDPKAVDLAVAAHVRHEHTDYDRLLMSGVERMDARSQIRDQIESLLEKWRG